MVHGTLTAVTTEEIVETTEEMPADRSDRTLVQRAVRGDAAAQRQLFLQHAPAVARLLRRLLGRGVDVEDGVQHCFLLALEHLRELQRPELFRQWILRIATRHARRAYWFDRLRRSLTLAAREEEPLWDARELARGLPADEQAQLVLAGKRLAALPLSLREPWVLRHVEGLKLEEIAEVCGCSLATTKRRLVEAQQRIAGGCS